MAFLFLLESLVRQVLFTKQSHQEGSISRSTNRCKSRAQLCDMLCPHPRPLAPEEKKERDAFTSTSNTELMGRPEAAVLEGIYLDLSVVTHSPS